MSLSLADGEQDTSGYVVPMYLHMCVYIYIYILDLEPFSGGDSGSKSRLNLSISAEIVVLFLESYSNYHHILTLYM